MLRKSVCTAAVAFGDGGRVNLLSQLSEVSLGWTVDHRGDVVRDRRNGAGDMWHNLSNCCNATPLVVSRGVEQGFPHPDYWVCSKCERICRQMHYCDGGEWAWATDVPHRKNDLP